MCYVIYGVLILLLGLYCDSLLESLALSSSNGEGGWVVIAQGWAMAAEIWPLLALAAVVASLITYQVVWRLMARSKD